MSKVNKTLIAVIALLLILVFVIGFRPNNYKDLVQKYEVERKYHLDQIDYLITKVDDLTKAGETIAKKMYEDSLRYSAVLKSNNEAYFKLKREYESINYSRASAAELDSIRAGLITLYSNRGK